MECKAKCQVNITTFKFIGIYPEWNVKVKSVSFTFSIKYIGIYPEWNVKSFISGSLRAVLPTLEYIQNGM